MKKPSKIKTVGGSRQQPRARGTGEEWRRLCKLRGDTLAVALLVRRGQLIEREKVSASFAECAHIMQSDLQAVGMTVAPLLEGKTIPEMKRIIDDHLNALLARWKAMSTENDL
jgi:hypothetical protein